MSSVDLTSLLQSFSLLSAFLLIGTFLRAKLKVFQNTFIPASVIGGFLLLILGPQVLNLVPIPDAWFKTYTALAGVLIVPVVVAVPLGLTLNGNARETSHNVLECFGIMLLATAVQLTVGFGVNMAFSAGGMDLYRAFGWELNMGFAGGHGTAGVLANLLQTAGEPYWETAQGVCITMATIGLVGGILVGMALINYAARHKISRYLDRPGAIPQSLRVGIEPDVNKQESAGRQTTLSASIDVVAFHMALILVVSGIAYLLLNFCKAYKVPVLSSLSVWAVGLALMFLVWYIMCKLKLDYLVDGKIKSRITGTLTEFAVISAVSSLNLKTVAVYLAPMLVMAVLGMIATIALLWVTTKLFITEDWFEHMIAILGMNTGVFLTGILLLRVADPDGKSTALADYSMGYTICGILTFALMPTYISVLINHGLPTLMGYLIAIGLASLAFCWVLHTRRRRA